MNFLLQKWYTVSIPHIIGTLVDPMDPGADSSVEVASQDRVQDSRVGGQEYQASRLHLALSLQFSASSSYC